MRYLFVFCGIGVVAAIAEGQCPSVGNDPYVRNQYIVRIATPRVGAVGPFDSEDRIAGAEEAENLLKSWQANVSTGEPPSEAFKRRTRVGVTSGTPKKRCGEKPCAKVIGKPVVIAKGLWLVDLAASGNDHAVTREEVESDLFWYSRSPKLALVNQTVRADHNARLEVLTGPGRRIVATGDDPDDAQYDAQRDVYEYFHIPTAWDTFDDLCTASAGAGGRTVLVALIDTGIESRQPDLKDRIKLERTVLQGKVFESTQPAGDSNGHGTAVAGIISAARDDIGIAGVGCGVHFVSIAFRGDPPTTADAVGALLEVERLQTVGVYIPVVNCSWRHALGVCRDDLKEEAAVIGTLQSHTLLVCAAGNDGSEIMPPKQVAGPVTSAADSDPCAKTSKAAVTSTIVAPVYPAAFKTEFGNVISITSCDRRGAPIESATNYGTSYVDLAAPGERVYTTRRQNPWYGYVSGSSIACSFVSGAAALLALKYDEDKFPAKDVRTQLCKAATQSAAWQKDAKEIYCHGAIDFAGLVATP